jgi:hypothetical protein
MRALFNFAITKFPNFSIVDPRAGLVTLGDDLRHVG